MTIQKIVNVLGATGIVGSNIVREALKKGYLVRGSSRHAHEARNAFLKKLPFAEENLIMQRVEMNDRNSLSHIFEGSDCVFIACLIPTYFGVLGKPAREMSDAEGIREIVRPTVTGCLNIMNEAVKQGVRNVVICSSTSSTNPIPPVLIKNEDHWSNEKEQYVSKKYTSAAKTVMEKQAIKFARDKGIRLSIIMPTGLYGPVILPEHMLGNPHKWLQRLVKGGAGHHRKIPNDSTSMIHLHDLAALFLAVYENSNASGRFFGVRESWHWRQIYTEIKKSLPEMQMPEDFEGDSVLPTLFDFTRRNSLGVKIRDIPSCIFETIEWIKREPFH